MSAVVSGSPRAAAAALQSSCVVICQTRERAWCPLLGELPTEAAWTAAALGQRHDARAAVGVACTHSGWTRGRPRCEMVWPRNREVTRRERWRRRGRGWSRWRRRRRRQRGRRRRGRHAQALIAR
eukprot:5299990-Prymnesium_polylepis.1